MITDEDESENEELEKVLNDIRKEKKYSGKCRQCDTHIEASRKYGLIQHFLEHKGICKVKTKTCTDCEYEANNALSLKRHMRDKHDVMSLSTSPPPKKTKIGDVKNTNNTVEDMDVDEGNTSKENTFENVDMSIDCTEIRSRRMDEKIKAKEKKTEEEERRQKQRSLEKEKADKIRQEHIKFENKKRKQKIKDEKKRSKRKKSIIKNDDKPGSDVPNIKPIPNNIDHLVGDGHKIYMVPGDGSCGPSSASAFLFKDEVFGPKLRRNMNKFMAKHWGKKYQYKTQCSDGHPFVRKIGVGGQVSFSDPKELIKYLENSEESGYMWTDSEDLSIIADMYQVKIKVITTKGEGDENPIVNLIVPDDDMKEYAELQNVDLGEMVLIHENDTHFNLIVPEDSELATVGSLSYRANIGPLTDDNKKQEEEEESKGADMNNDKSDIKIELKKANEKNKYIEKEYNKCKEELKIKTEEIEKLKIEVKDLKEVMKLANNHNHNQMNLKIMNQDNDCDITEKYKSDLTPHRQTKHTDKHSNQCKICNEICETKEKLSLHITNEHGSHSSKQEKEFNCNYCSFQTTEQRHFRNHFELVHTLKKNFKCNRCEYVGITSSDLSKHIEWKHVSKTLECSVCQLEANSANDLRAHMKREHEIQEQFRCRICCEAFRTKGNLMEHRKKEHLKTVAFCKNKGDCVFSNEKCWWNHDDQQDSKSREETFKCYICGDTFQQRGEMMVHKKSKHKESTRFCNLFLDAKCPFKDVSCWFRHDDIQEKVSFEENDEEITENTVFQEVQENLEPPIRD